MINPGNTHLAAIKTVLFAACLLPAFLLWRGFELDTLGANPIEAITRGTGDWTLRFLLITLAVVLPMRSRFALIAAWRRLFMALCAGVLGIRYRVVGAENIPSQPAVILSRHESAWETVALQDIFPDQVFVLKKSLLMIPFLGWAFAAVKMISIDRSAGKNALKQIGRASCRERVSSPV